MANHNEAPVEIFAYDPAWPLRFESERQLLAGVLQPWLSGEIEHIGSTAVPGLPAKPVIDIMAPVRSLDESRSAIEALKQPGYVYFPYRSDVMHWFCKPSPAIRTHHLHLVPFGSRLWTERLTFRDYLRSHASAAAEYAAMKDELANVFRFDREAYTDAKGPFIERILAAARDGGDISQHQTNAPAD